MREMIPKRIGAIDFALMGPKEVRKLSATKVITADTYDDDGLLFFDCNKRLEYFDLLNHRE